MEEENISCMLHQSGSAGPSSEQFGNHWSKKNTPTGQFIRYASVSDRHNFNTSRHKFSKVSVTFCRFVDWTSTMCSNISKMLLWIRILNIRSLFGYTEEVGLDVQEMRNILKKIQWTKNGLSYCTYCNCLKVFKKCPTQYETITTCLKGWWNSVCFHTYMLVTPNLSLQFPILIHVNFNFNLIL